MRKDWILILGLLVTLATVTQADDPTLHAGFRGSKIYSYTPTYWWQVADSMSRNFTRSAQPAAVWIVTFYGNNGDIYATFPSGGAPLAHVSYPSVDYNESFLDEFDSRGMRVWLQVEPGAADVAALITAILDRYQHHPCIAGFGIDVEWLDTQLYAGGRRVTDSEAAAWDQQVRARDTTDLLFLKHYATSRMPPQYRGKILFVDDSQQFSGLNSCLNEFAAWAAAFAPSPVGFQFGYPDDRPWWSLLQDPPQAIGNGILARAANTQILLWVDFTVTEVFPPGFVAVLPDELLPEQPLLCTVYPNPFNASAIIQFTLPARSNVRVEVFDVTGRPVAVVFSGIGEAGLHRVRFNAIGLASGPYFVRLQAGSSAQTKRLLLLR